MRNNLEISSMDFLTEDGMSIAGMEEHRWKRLDTIGGDTGKSTDKPDKGVLKYGIKKN
jgi:hypothetical protein